MFKQERVTKRLCSLFQVLHVNYAIFNLDLVLTQLSVKIIKRGILVKEMNAFFKCCYVSRLSYRGCMDHISKLISSHNITVTVFIWYFTLHFNSPTDYHYISWPHINRLYCSDENENYAKLPCPTNCQLPSSDAATIVVVASWNSHVMDAFFWRWVFRFSAVTLKYQ